MARKLPWLTGEAGGGKNRQHTPRKRRKLSLLDSDQEVSPLKETKIQGRLGGIARGRTPSTSPPPAPPVQEFMHEGPDGDDRYVMVEDEFHAIAKTFTQHLHHAEYIRLKEDAKKRTRASPQPPMKLMGPPVHKYKRSKNKIVQEDPSESEGDTDEDTRAGTHLQRLMTEGIPSRRPLPGVAGRRSTTKAAAGFGMAAEARVPYTSGDSRTGPPKDIETPEQDTEEETASEDTDDDLDMPLQAFKSGGPPTNELVASTQGPIEKSRPLKNENSPGRTTRRGKETTAEAEVAAFPSTTGPSPSTKRSNVTQMSSRPPSLAPLPTEASSWLERKAARARRGASAELKTKEQSTSLNDIPTFLA